MYVLKIIKMEYFTMQQCIEILYIKPACRLQLILGMECNKFSFIERKGSF